MEGGQRQTSRQYSSSNNKLHNLSLSHQSYHKPILNQTICITLTMLIFYYWENMNKQHDPQQLQNLEILRHTLPINPGKIQHYLFPATLNCNVHKWKFFRCRFFTSKSSINSRVKFTKPSTANRFYLPFYGIFV